MAEKAEKNEGRAARIREILARPPTHPEDNPTTTWRHQLEAALAHNGELMEDICSAVGSDGPDEADPAAPESDAWLDREFAAGYGMEGGSRFTVWTERRVYFPICYDGSEWVGSVSRHPDGRPTRHQGR